MTQRKGDFLWSHAMVHLFLIEFTDCETLTVEGSTKQTSGHWLNRIVDNFEHVTKVVYLGKRKSLGEAESIILDILEEEANLVAATKRR